jgi:hypothetical protein
VSLLALNIAGLPGALIAARASDKSQSVGGALRFAVGVIVSALGQSYIYLAFVAFIVSFTKHSLHGEGVFGPVLWPMAFIASFAPIYLCATAGVGEAATGQSEWNPQVYAIGISEVLAVIGFFVFAFFPNVIALGWPWIPYAQTIYSRSRPEIVLHKGIITVNGQELVLPTTLSACKSIFGEPTRSVAKLNTIYVWDELGIYCLMKPADQQVIEFVLAAEHESRSFAPIRPFTGLLRVDGVTIPMDFSTRSITEINTKLNGQKFTPDDTLPFLWKRTDGTIDTTLEFSDDGAGKEIIFGAK